jgi:hypothetical protein
MQNPGVSRAIPLGILGFLVGALIVIILRGLQSLDPLWQPGVGIVFGALFCAAFFMWGIGAFNPKLSEHGGEEEHAHHEEVTEADEKPSSILSGSVWQLMTWTVIGLVVLFAFALWGGLTLNITADPLASTTAVGYFTLQLPFGGPEIPLSELVVFIAFVVWMFISLAAAAAIFAWLFHFLSRGLVESRSVSTAAALPAGQTAGALPSGQDATVSAPAPETMRSVFAPQSLLQFGLYLAAGLILYFILYTYLFGGFLQAGGDLQVAASLIIAFGAALFLRPGFLGVYVFTAIVLYYVFYFVLIGLVLPQQPALTLLSIVNALVVAFIILKPNVTLQLVGRLAALLARFVRWLPKLLFQR